ncbi:MAG: 50S ribosomal protein L11 methyltransferase [Spirochaetia bacterium]|nr:50S ribosomal protein L11 methyltransferase [Spirochaetia bacterium]
METAIFKEITAALLPDDALTLVKFLDQNKFPKLHGYYEVLYDEDKASIDTELSKIVMYFSAEDNEADIRLEIILSVLGIESVVREEKNITRNEYLENYKKHYTSFLISKHIMIVPSWEKQQFENQKNSSQLFLYLDPGLAFGTGLHPTTRLCMEYLDENPPKKLNVIDAGCGSGILSFGALLLGAEEVLAFDVDGNAVLAVENNFELNAFNRNRMTLMRGGFDLNEFLEYPADILLGNLTASVILSNKKRIDEGKYSQMMLSGILEEKKEEVISAFQTNWECSFQNHLDGWSLIVFNRK